MAKFENLPNQITDLATEWDGHSGMEVEDFLTRLIETQDSLIIVGGKYEGEVLELHKKSGRDEDIIKIPVTVLEPTYSYGVYIYALKVDDGTIINRDLNSQIIQYTSSKNYLLGIAAYATADTSSRYDRFITLPVKIKYGDGNSITYNITPSSYTYFTLDGSGNVSGLEIPEGENIDNVVKWINVNEIFTTSQEDGILSATIVPDLSTTSVLTDSFTTKITVQIISLAYKGDIVLNSNVANFTLNGANSTAYMLEAYNLNGKISNIDTSASNLYCPLLSGLNKLIVRAVHKTQNTIYTDWVYVDIISTIDCNETVVAINGVANGIRNNSIAKLYDIKIYSPNNETVNLVTYLVEQDPGSGSVNPSDSDLLKLQVITSYDYNNDHIYKTEYYKYIETRSAAAKRYLIVKTNSSFYSFIELEEDGIVESFFKIMPISAVNYNYCYYDVGVTKSFDLISAYINDVFITEEYAKAIGKEANVSSTLEISDGWKEDNGVVYFKVSAQDTPIVTLTDLGLGNNFTLELGFKTYNISDESKPILTLGKLQLRPTLLCWDIDTSLPNAEATFGSRNAIFLENIKTHITVTVTKDFTIKKGETYYPDYLGSFQETFDNNMSSTNSTTNKFNLVRVLIDDVIDREFIITDDELEGLKKSSLIINPTTADIDFYLVRLYNQTALNFDLIQLNYISYLTNDTSIDNDDPKKVFYDKNDILDSDGEISFTKSYKKFNTFVIVFPQDPTDKTRTNLVPTRAWGGKDNSDPTPNDYLPSTLFITYADEDINKTYGGRISGVRIRGQGTSAMRYFIWNTATHLTKAKRYITKEDGTLDLTTTEKMNSSFIPYKNLDPETNKFTEKSGEIKKGYIMPPYDGRQSTNGIITVKKAVGKVNYASSMQSHKMGFCKLYDDFYQSQKGALPTGGRKAVQQDQFLYFYLYADKYDVSKIELADLLAADAGTNDLGKLKFMGFLTWGSGKADDLTYGYDEDLTPGYILFEGGENGDTAVNFRCPWQALLRNPVSWNDISNPLLASTLKLMDYPLISYEDSLAKPWERLWISGDESIIYDPNTADVTGAWDVDYGLEEVTDPVSDATLGFRLDVKSDEEANIYIRNSIKTFREFYDFVYTHDYNIRETNDSDPANWTDTNHKYCCTNSSCKASVTHKANDVYRYNKLLDDGTGKKGVWVPAGVEFDITTQQWKPFNLVNDVGSSSVNTIAKAKAYLKKEITEKLAWNGEDAANSGCLDTVDAAIHLAITRITSSTDCRAKNTYFRVTGPLLSELEVPVYNEDGTPALDKDGNQKMDTVFVAPDDYETNTRKYHYVGFMQDDTDTILATDNNGLQTKLYNLLEPSYRWSDYKYWGDSGSNAFFYMFDLCFEEDINTWVEKMLTFAFENPDVNNKSNRFYKYFFNVLETYPAIAYNHTAKIYYELGLLVLNTKSIPNFASNDLLPILLSHGSCINSEKNYMSKRIIFLGTLTRNGTIGGQGNLPVNPGSGSGGSTLPVKIKMEFSPYIDMYPLFAYTGLDYIYSNGIQSDPIALRYLTEAGKDYSTYILRTADSNNNNISLINYYKKLKLTGLQSSSLGKVPYTRATSFTIDNNLTDTDIKNGLTESNFTDSEIPSFPVVEDFTLTNMNLPETFDTSSFAKLRRLNLSKTTTKYVIFPNTGRLNTVILPGTLETLKIFNNPGLLETKDTEIDGIKTQEGLIIEDTSKLKTIEIECLKCGKFDVNNLCELLINCNDLQSVTLRNANLYITEDALRKMILTNTCNLTGDIYIVNTAGSTLLKAISFATKLLLVNTFGDISSSSSKIRIHFQSAEITEFSCAKEVSVYYQTGESGTIVRQNLFNITVDSGNDVEIKSGANPFNPNVNGYLDITYAMTGVGSDVATIDLTGAITLKKESSSTATVTISMKVANSTTALVKTSTVSFAWKAPSLGDFAYADGTFTSSYDASKTMIGLVYAKLETDDTSGTVYIIGKEYSSLNSYYLGYSAEAESLSGSTDLILANLHLVSLFLKETDMVNTENYEAINGLGSPNKVDNITVNTYTSTGTSDFYGQSDTALYVQHVNKNILKELYTQSKLGYDSCKPYITRTQVTTPEGTDYEYSISSLENLDNLCTAVRNIYTNISDSDIMNCLLYPYFYSMYVYEPSVNEGEALHDSYKKGNWYAPSVAELSRIIYYRGYSASGSNFNVGYLVRSAISTSVENGGTVLTTPIFSLALSRASNKFPSVWSSVVGSGSGVSGEAGVNNITTTADNDASNNWSYQNVSSYSSEYIYTNRWIVGARAYPDGWNLNQAYSNAWRLTKHQGIPFTKFNYLKNG